MDALAAGSSWFRTFILLGLHAVTSVQGDSSDPDDQVTRVFRVPQVSDADSWRSMRNCGPNALYAYLRILGRDEVSLERVQQLVPVNDRGSSLEQLKEAADTLGVPSRVIQLAPDTLSRVPLPAIAHYSGVNLGHFVLVLAIKGDTVVLGDATTCKIYENDLDTFKRTWSGYLLVQRAGGSMFGVNGIIGIAVVGLSIGCLLFAWVQSRQSVRRSTEAAMKRVSCSEAV